MNDVKVSVIIATYNTAVYIEECLDSILSQTLREIEVIIMDDGSTDNTQEILKKYTDLYRNVFVYYQKNMGAGLARNRGIGLAKGKYIVFMDPDDKYPVKDCLEMMYQTIKANDVIICGGNIIGNNNGNAKRVYSAGDGTEKKIRNGIVKSTDYFYLYGHTRYMLQSKFLREANICFAPYKRFEDQVLTIDALGKAGKFYELDYPVYEYRVNYKSDQYDKAIYLDMFKGFRDTLQRICLYNMKAMYEKNCQSFIEGYMPQICAYAGRDKEFHRVVEEINHIIMASGWSCNNELITEERILRYKQCCQDMKNKFENICKESKKLILYGAGRNTKKLLQFYKSVLPDIIGIAVTNTDVRNEMEGIEIHPIEYYIPVRDETTVVVTPAIRNRNTIFSVLDKYGFKQYEWIDINLICQKLDF